MVGETGIVALTGIVVGLEFRVLAVVWVGAAAARVAVFSSARRGWLASDPRHLIATNDDDQPRIHYLP